MVKHLPHPYQVLHLGRMGEHFTSQTPVPKHLQSYVKRGADGTQWQPAQTVLTQKKFPFQHFLYYFCTIHKKWI